MTRQIRRILYYAMFHDDGYRGMIQVFGWRAQAFQVKRWIKGFIHRHDCFPVVHQLAYWSYWHAPVDFFLDSRRIDLIEK